jgi:membrane peptidoglycan carboxypeptidase
LSATPLRTGLLTIIILVLVAILISISLLYARICFQLPSLDVLPVLLNTKNGELLSPTTIMDRENLAVIYNFDNPGIERRFLVVNPDLPEHFSPQLIRAAVFKLDPTFWENPGVSFDHLRDENPYTIAERLADDLLLWDEPDSTIRPLRMRLLAAQVVSRFGRTQVLEWYLNSVYLGHRAFGAESAAQLYFQKSAEDLTLAESAMLVALIESPAINPLDAPASALELQRMFLAQMAEAQVITTEEFTTAVREKLNLRENISDPTSIAAAFAHHAEQQLNSSFGHNRLGRGGLAIISTLDEKLQKQFLCTIQAQLIRLQGPSASGFAPDESQCEAALLLPTQVFSGMEIQKVTAAGLAMDPKNGEVLVYVEPTNSQGVSQADTGFEPGSLLTPFSAVAGFARGFSPSSMKWDVPSTSADGSPDLQNPDGQYHGPVSIRSAVANDYLIPMIEVTNQINPSNVGALVSALGMPSIGDTMDSTGLLQSGGKTSLLEVGTAYGTLANSGVRSGILDPVTNEIKPNFVQRVDTVTRRPLFNIEHPVASSVLSEPLAYLINNVLSDETARWPSMGYPNPLEIGQPAAAKVGQVASKSQVWTVGYTPQRLVLVWMGQQKENSTSMLDTRATAGIWHAMIKTTSQGLSNSGWSMPAGVTEVNVCIPSGMLPTADCPNTMTEVFLTGNEPTGPDKFYERIKVNKETGQRATVFTPSGLVEDRLFIDVPQDARDWAIKAGLAVAPLGYDSIPNALVDPGAMITSPEIFSPVSDKVEILGTASGDKFKSFSLQIGEGINPNSWLQVGQGSAPVTVGRLADWDTTGLNGLYAIRLNVVDTDQTLRSAVIQVTVDNIPPLARILYPRNDQTIQSVRGSVTLVAEVQDTVGLEKVEWWIDGKLVSTQINAPFAWQIEGKQGEHTVLLKAWDTAGNQVKTDLITFTIAP